jgi:AcrR family transcriptional regulator
MNLREKRKNELECQKEKRKEEVIVSAIEIIKKNGIDNTKIKDIAEKAEVGVASVYRYFKTKTDIVIATAIWIWEKEISLLKGQFYEKTYMELNGAKKVRRILSVFTTAYQENPDFIRFLEEFDNYIVKERISTEKLENYEKSIINLKSIMIEALNQGKKDGSIKQTVDNDAFYMTITHSLMSLSQKLALRGYILLNDSEVKGDTQLNLLIDMAMNYICTK